MAKEWTCDTLTESYDPHNYVVHNGSRGILISYIPAKVAANFVHYKVPEKMKKKVNGRWAIYMLHGIHPDFNFDDTCQKLGSVSNNKENPDKSKSLMVAIDFAKRKFMAGRFDPSIDDIARDPTIRTSENSGKLIKEAVHGSGAGFDPSSWESLSTTNLVRANPLFGGGTFENKRKSLNDWRNNAQIGDSPEEQERGVNNEQNDYKAFKDVPMDFGWSSDKKDIWGLVVTRYNGDIKKFCRAMKEQYPVLDISIKFVGEKDKQKMMIWCGSESTSLKVARLFDKEKAFYIRHKIT
ncbi:MAG: hypothetical protein AABY32_02685 [Nanoarchaeota archaeon]